MRTTPNQSYRVTIRLEIINQVGMFVESATAIGEEGGDIDSVDRER